MHRLYLVPSFYGEGLPSWFLFSLQPVFGWAWPSSEEAVGKKNNQGTKSSKEVTAYINHAFLFQMVASSVFFNIYIYLFDCIGS